MDRLIKTGKIIPKKSSEIKFSKFGIGFEKLDRDVFDPEKAYDKIEKLGVKWVRIQSGWAKTEKRRGEYDFEWLDCIVDNLLKRGLIPWMCLCYGNELYTEAAAKVFGAVGCPPINSDEEKDAWSAYVTALAKHFTGRIKYYEVWNEPDGIWCWKHGPSGTEYGRFVADTAKAVKKGDCDAKIIGGATCLSERLDFLYDAFKSGMAGSIDALSFHEYVTDETIVLRHVKALRGLCNYFSPQIEIIQGESGSQSRGNGKGALKKGGWNPQKQAKQLLRHTVADLMTEVKFTSYFSCVDMIEALNGEKGKLASYQDYGYFGVLGAEFDEEGHSIGEYSPKPSYYAMQTLAAMFSNDVRVEELPVMRWTEVSDRLFGNDCDDASIVTCGFKKDNGSAAFVFWNSTNLMTTSFESTVSLHIAALPEKVRLVDLMDGTVYEIPDSILEQNGDTKCIVHNIPIRDYPMALIFGDFADYE